MARIAYITKYPPLEGGMAAKAYWLARALGDRGHEVHIITDAITPDDPYYIHDTSVEENHPNVFIHRATSEVPWIIPHERHSALSLLDKTFEVIETINPDVICAAYLVPYGLVGCLTSDQSNVPLVLHHGGSDINKFLLPGVWANIWDNYLEKSNLIVTDVENAPTLSSFTNQITTMPPYVPDPTSFLPIEKEPKDRPVLAIIGKANYHWRHKGWHRVIDIWSKINAHCEFLVLCQGTGINDLKKFVLQALGDEVTWRNFIHPSAMPNLLWGIDYLFNFEQDLPHTVYSNLAIESLNCGTKLVCENRIISKNYSIHGLDIAGFEPIILNVPSDDASKAAAVIERDFDARRCSLSVNKHDFNCYIDKHEKTIMDACKHI